MTDRQDRAAEERAAMRIRVAAADIVAPQRLRAAVAERRLATRPPRTRRSRPFVLAAGGALAACVAVLLVFAGSETTTTGGSVADAAQVALRSPTAPAPAPGSPGHLRLSVGGVTFPDYARVHGWRAVGTRTDHVRGRTVVTVIYARGAQRVGYAIVSGRPLTVPAGSRHIAYEGVRVAALRSGDARYITWTRGGRTCVLATRGAALSRLLDFAARR